MKKQNFKKPRLINKNRQRGVSLIEVLIAAAVISLVLVGLVMVGNLALKISVQLKKNIIATNLAAEVIEATKAVKQESWSNISSLALSVPYHPTKTGSPQKWTLTPDSESVDGFLRQVILSPVYRDTNDDIVTSGGTLDPETKKITASVFWSERGQNYQTNLTLYLANWKP
jgi:prepilin-type N-terminal cleavage/methylation domain-containing protein